MLRLPEINTHPPNFIQINLVNGNKRQERKDEGGPVGKGFKQRMKDCHGRRK